MKNESTWRKENKIFKKVHKYYKYYQEKGVHGEEGEGDELMKKNEIYRRVIFLKKLFYYITKFLCYDMNMKVLKSGEEACNAL